MRIRCPSGVAERYTSRKQAHFTFEQLAAVLGQCGRSAGELNFQQGIQRVADSADRLYGDALEALVRIQLASRPGALPEYSRELLARELALFPDWYVARQLGRELRAHAGHARGNFLPSAREQSGAAAAYSCTATITRAT